MMEETKPIKVRSRVVKNGSMKLDRFTGDGCCEWGDFCWEVRCASGCGGNETKATFHGYISNGLDNGIVFLRRDEIAEIVVHCWDATKGFPSPLSSSFTDDKKYRKWLRLAFARPSAVKTGWLNTTWTVSRCPDVETTKFTSRYRLMGKRSSVIERQPQEKY